MIIKRRVTLQFVQLDNAIVRDQRLSLDEHGMLHYLLSLPDAWEVNLRQIEKFWRIGSRKRKRIFRSLRRFGWAQYERLTDDDGNYIGSRWIICDEPGQPMADETAFADDEAGEVDDNDEDGEPLAATKSDSAPESQAPADSASQGNRTGAYATGAPRTGCETHPTQNSTAESRRKTLEEHRDSKNTTGDVSRDENEDGAPPPSFGQVLKQWPADNVASAYACERAFGRLTPWQRRQARETIPKYLSDCRNKGQNRICDLRTYLDERRWEKFTDRGATGPTRFACKRGTPQAMRWREHFERTEPHRLRLFDTLMATSGHYTTESEWPPPKGPAREGGTLSDEDAHELSNL